MALNNAAAGRTPVNNIFTESKIEKTKTQLFHVSENEHEAWNLIKDIPD